MPAVLSLSNWFAAAAFSAKFSLKAVTWCAISALIASGPRRERVADARGVLAQQLVRHGGFFCEVFVESRDVVRHFGVDRFGLRREHVGDARGTVA